MQLSRLMQVPMNILRDTSTDDSLKAARRCLQALWEWRGDHIHAPHEELFAEFLPHRDLLMLCGPEQWAFGILGAANRHVIGELWRDLAQYQRFLHPEPPSDEAELEMALWANALAVDPVGSRTFIMTDGASILERLVLLYMQLERRDYRALSTLVDFCAPSTFLTGPPSRPATDAVRRQGWAYLRPSLSKVPDEHDVQTNDIFCGRLELLRLLRARGYTYPWILAAVEAAEAS